MTPTNRFAGAGIVFSAGTFAYFAAVMQRSSLGVASLTAADRFNVSASSLAGLAVFQLVVYAAFQIPVGLLLDRFGARRMLLIGALAMALGQLVVAWSTQIETAYLGRMLVGAGDAFTFISMLRLIVSWGRGRKIARVQQLMVNVGQLGQLASAIPFAIALASMGWSSSFEIAAMIATLSALVVVAFIRNSPTTETSHRVESLRHALANLRESVRFAGTRMSFWIHFTLQSSGSVFALLWGVPFLVEGQGLSREFASVMLSVQLLLGFVFGTSIGWIAHHRPQLRPVVIISIALAIIGIWSVFAFVPGRAPVWLVVVLVVVISSGGPASMLAMDYSREFIAPAKLGAANGFINIGGFLATFVMMAMAGWLLDLVKTLTRATETFSLLGFRVALTAQVLVIAFGLVMYLVERRKTLKTHSL